MALLFLTNTAAANVLSLETAGASISSGYEQGDAIAGPRSRLVRADAGTSHSWVINTTSHTVSHVVLGRADFFAGGLNASQIKVEYGSGPSTDSTTAAGSMTLLGPKDQDWVKTIAQTSTSFRLTFEHSSSSATMYSKVYFSNGFDFGSMPQLVESRIDEQRVKPLLGYQFHQTERVFTLRWQNITQSKMASFRALPLHWPLFLYDESGYLFDHKLEHCVVGESDAWREKKKVDGSFDVDVTLRRIAYYD